MGIVVTYLAVILGCGLLARIIRLPPLIGFLGAGFVLNTLNVDEIDGLAVLAEIGVALMLFAIGLRLDLRSLLGKHVWVTASAHMALLTGLGMLFLAGMSAIGIIAPESWPVLATLALVLSFSSTIFVIKILQERGDEQSLYGNICIGVLILQDIAAVVVISISRGEAPSLYSLGLLLLIPVLYWATRHWYRLGHGDLGALFGIAMALVPGYALFEWLGLSGNLGALVMGLVLAPHPGADQLSTSLFTVKELLLVGFFVTIGFTGLPTWHNVAVGMVLLILLPLQALAYWGLLWLLGMRNRTSVLSALLLANYSEFALIIAAMGVSAGWLAPHWLLSLSIAVSVGFVVSAVANPRSVSLASRFAHRLPTRPPDKIHPDDRPIELGDASAIVLGMGRVGKATYRQLTDEYGYKVLGVEHDPARVHKLQRRGVNIVEGDATDYDFWARLMGSDTVRIVVLAMPAQHTNIDALRELRSFGYGHVTVAAVASYVEDVEELRELGLDAVIRLYEGAGETLADRTVEAARRARRR